MAYFDEKTTRKKKAEALLILMHLRELRMDFMILFLDTVPVGQFTKKNLSESFIHSRFQYNAFSGESWDARFSAPR